MILVYELEELEALITCHLHPKKVLHSLPPTSGQLESWSRKVLLEKDEIRKRLKKMTYSFKKEPHRILYIRQHQSAIIHLKNRLVEYLIPMDIDGLKEKSDDSHFAKLYKECLSALRALLDFIKEEFPQYFNYEERIPESKMLKIHSGIKPGLWRLQKQLIKNGEDASLVEIIVQTIIAQCNNETCLPFTYTRWQYIKDLMASLEQIHSHESQVSYYPRLIRHLVYMNFNASSFRNYFVNSIHAEINAGNSLHHKMEIISFHCKEINQLRVMTGIGLAPSLPTVQQDLVTWLGTEMTHLEKKHSLGIVEPAGIKEGGEQDSEKGIYSQLTVEEIGLLFKIQKDTDLLKNRNMKQVARAVAAYWHSKQKENISWQYLYNSMSTVEMGTIRSLEDKLIGMVNWLRKMKGGLTKMLIFPIIALF